MAQPPVIPSNSSPTSGNAPIGGQSDIGKEGILNLLMEDDAPPANTDNKDNNRDNKEEEQNRQTRGKEKEDEGQGEEEEEIDLNLDGEHDEEDVINKATEDYHVPVPRAVILKKYPDLFKDFPALQASYYRDQQFTEKIGTPADADELIQKAERLDKYEQDISRGSIETILKEVKENDEQAYGQIIENYLPALAKNDPNAYTHVVSSVISNAISQLLKEGTARKDEELQDAAKILNAYIFGTEQPVAPSRFAKEQPKELSEAEKRIQEREQKFLENRYNEARESLGTKVSNVLRASVEQHIDPHGRLSDYEKRSAVREAVELTQESIANDRMFLKTIDGLWRNAFKKEFDSASVNQIRSAYLSKARTVLPDMIKKVRSEVLKNNRRTSNTEENSGRGRGPQRPINQQPRTSTSSNNSGRDDGDKPARRKSTLDFFNED